MLDWTPPAPPDEGADLLNVVDPRVPVARMPGEPCPSNPPPPIGWDYWDGPLPAGGSALAVRMRDDKAAFPMGSFVQTWLGGQLVGVRIEWHTTKGATGAQGCFRGVNLMKPSNHQQAVEPSTGTRA